MSDTDKAACDLILAVHGPHGITRLVRHGGRYVLAGDAPDRTALLMLARGIIEDATDDERAGIGADDWR